MTKRQRIEALERELQQLKEEPPKKKQKAIVEAVPTKPPHQLKRVMEDIVNHAKYYKLDEQIRFTFKMIRQQPKPTTKSSQWVRSVWMKLYVDTNYPITSKKVIE